MILSAKEGKGKATQENAIVRYLSLMKEQIMDDSDTKGLVFSARKGNCLDFASYILRESRIIHIAGYRISPCQRCRYQCFHNNACPEAYENGGGISGGLIETERSVINWMR